MGKRMDLVGQKYGQLTVISLYKIAENYNSIWLCRCDCGRSEDFPVFHGNLRSKVTTACRICQYEKNAQARIKDLTGCIFGHITVVGMGENHYISPSGCVDRRWWCKCDCGKSDRFLVRGSRLRDGKTKMCILCVNREKGVRRFQDLTGEIFGWLRVIEFDRRENKRTHWICYCDPELGGCGRTRSFYATSLKSGDASSCGCKVESIIATALKKYCEENYSAISEYAELVNPKTNAYLPYDVFIPKGKIYIEVQGPQHYKFIPHFHETKKEFEKSRERDKLKKEHAQVKGRFIEIDLRRIKTSEQAIEFLEKKLSKIKL